MALHGITQKNGKPFKPTTQGKIERFWQTLAKHLRTQHPATLTELQHVLDTFRDYYNHQRPHRGINRKTPAHAYQVEKRLNPHSVRVQPFTMSRDITWSG
ncbi:integrase core domain-containing protein [Ruania albidiflava]|uniref:integrase core domain-containing protein n=1 Tax=Ruania albidiflava TaxID=366586 RepID=UPI000A0251DB